MKRKMLAQLCLVALLASVPGLASAERYVPTDTDRDIRNRIVTQTMGVPGEFDADVRNGEVTLIGTVRDIQGMNEIVQDARNAQGVISVTNELSLASPWIYGAYALDDDTIATNVRYILRPYHQVSVGVDRGTAVLSGMVPTPDDRDRVTRMAYGVEGVRNVKNDVGVEMYTGE